MSRVIELKNQPEFLSPIDTAQLIESASRLDPEKRGHFLWLMKCLLDCYGLETEQAVLIMKSETDGCTSIAAVNAREDDVEQLVGLASQAIRARSDATLQGMVN